jgi:hypothetical protein
MTLIISKTSRNFVLQVTDRLVTERIESLKTFKSFDPLANKNIIFCALNGILSFAYTGHAYIGNNPTDQWLAEKLIGKKLKDNLPFVECGAIKICYIGPALQTLIEALNRAYAEDIEHKFKKDWLEKRFDLCFEGYVWNKKRRFRPFNGDIFKSTNSEKFYIRYSDRHWYSEAIITGAPAANVSQEQLEKLTKALRNKEPDETESIISEFIQDISTNNLTVGSDCISILIPSPSEAHLKSVRVRFIPKSEHLAYKPQISEDQIKIAYSPWVIGPRMVCPPAMLGNTGFNARLGRCLYEIKMEAPSTPGEGMFVEAQKRKELC